MTLNVNVTSTDTPQTRLERISSLNIDLGLDRMLRALKLFDDPQLRLPPVIHVAGTNGKGSTLATLRSILEAGGYTCHMMTSPHLVRLNERFIVAGEEITDAALHNLIDRCMEKGVHDDLTFFELTTLIGLLAFAENEADVVLLETGLGGRLDATNVIPDPACTIITRISHDHQGFLGDTLDQIAGEKAGIIKPNVPCIIGRQSHNESEKKKVLETFKQKAKNLKAPLYVYDESYTIKKCTGTHMTLGIAHDSLHLPTPNLTGTHQPYNAAAALMALYVLRERYPIPQEKLEKGLTSIHWPGRMQRLHHHPYVRLLGDGSELWIDGGHNDSAGEIIAAQLQWWHDHGPKPIHMIVGMMDNKDPLAFLHPIAPFVNQVYFTSIPGHAAHTPQGLRETTSDLFDPARVMQNSDVQKIVENLKNKNNIRILITGSLYLIGEILSQEVPDC